MMKVSTQNQEKYKRDNYSRFSFIEVLWHNSRPLKRKIPIKIFISKFEREKRNNQLNKFLLNRLVFSNVSK